MVRRHYGLPSPTALLAFEAAARHGSLTRAAAELNVTPGALSRQVKRLEAEAGCALFRRGHRSLEPTAEGETLRAVLADSLTAIAEVFARIQAQGAAGPAVTLGTTTAFAQLWLMPRLGAFWRAHPEIRIDHVISDRAQELGRAGIDLRIRYGQGRWRGEAAVALYNDCIYPVAGPALAASYPEATAERLASLPLLQVEGVDPDWIDWEAWLRLAGLPARRSGSGATFRRFTSYVVALQAAQDDQGVALGWHSLVAPLLQEGRLCRLGTLEVRDPGAFYLTWTEGRPLSAEAAALRDWLLQEAAAVA